MVAFAFVASSLRNWKVSTRLCSNDRTHVKDLENLVKARPPGGDLLSVVLRHIRTSVSISFLAAKNRIDKKK